MKSPKYELVDAESGRILFIGDRSSACLGNVLMDGTTVMRWDEAVDYRLHIKAKAAALGINPARIQ